MKKFISIFILLVAISTSVFSNPQRQRDSQKDSKKEVEITKPRRKEPPRRPRHSRDVIAESIGEALFDLVVDILIDLSVETNLHVIFDSYPYATSDFFIQYDDFRDDLFPSKIMRFDAGGNIMFFPGSAILAPSVRFDGFFYKCIGPIVENTNYISFSRKIPYFGNYKLGFELATFQTFPFSWSWNFEWVSYYGQAFTNGFNFGFILKSYPVNPLVLEYRLNFTFLEDNVCLAEYIGLEPTFCLESYLEVGYMMYKSPAELYFSWRYLVDGPMQIEDHGFGIGVKYHF